jgi:hypothetical protein
VSGVVYVISDHANASTSPTTSDTISWGKIVVGALFLQLAVRQWRGRPAAGAEPAMPKWMRSIDIAKGLGSLTS